MRLEETIDSMTESSAEDDKATTGTPPQQTKGTRELVTSPGTQTAAEHTSIFQSLLNYQINVEKKMHDSTIIGKE